MQAMKALGLALGILCMSTSSHAGTGALNPFVTFNSELMAAGVNAALYATLKKGESPQTVACAVPLTPNVLYPHVLKAITAGIPADDLAELNKFFATPTGELFAKMLITYGYHKYGLPSPYGEPVQNDEQIAETKQFQAKYMDAMKRAMSVSSAVSTTDAVADVKKTFDSCKASTTTAASTTGSH
ncbi:hypothetical protein [Niveibacterium microcysteis]|uniref:DUF2059 domain-containing protein n=1 Tax=Niveibacterium microcysteis TaxID=2811415 RepID=A0ABX7M663_9RHOO|nr:hypothetical protein [Niveibacterium microcysteis]QSI76638.1 hypothetical protein JY500_19605 [Niveibacterium microcysteis]